MFSDILLPSIKTSINPNMHVLILRFSSWAEIRMRYFFRPKRCAPSRAWVVCPPSLWRLWTSEESGKKFMVFWWIWREPQGGFRAPKTSPHLTILRFLVDWIDLGGDIRTGHLEIWPYWYNTKLLGMKIYDFLWGQLFVYFQLFVYLVPNSTIIADMTLLIQFKVVSNENWNFWWHWLLVYFQLFVYMCSKPGCTCRYDLTDTLQSY